MPRHGIHVLGGAMPEPIDFVLPFTQEEIKVVGETARVLECDLPSPGGRRPNRRLEKESRDSAAPRRPTSTPLTPAQPLENLLRLETVAGSQDGDLHGCGNPVNERPIRKTRIRLRGGPAMDCDSRGAGIFHTPGQLGCIDGLFRSTRARILHGHGEF